MDVDLKPLLDVLPTGWAETVRKSTGNQYSTGHIRHVVTGRRWNKDIAEAVIELANKHKSELMALQAKIAQITDAEQAPVAEITQEHPAA